MWTVQVIGAGPAGSSAAISAMLHASSPLILEKSRFPRHKVCGEFLSPEIRLLLEHLDCLKEFEDLHPVPIHRVSLHFGAREKRCALSEPAFGLSRYALDRMLFDKAVALGAVAERGVWNPESSTLGSGGRILAAGRKSAAPRGGRLFGFKAHFDGPAAEGVDLFFFDHCYAGVSPVESGRTNVCGLAPEELLRASGFHPEELLARSGPLSARLSPLRRTMDWLIVGPLVFQQKFSQPSEESAYRAGDSLGFTDPFTGSGILNAMLTGFLAGRAAARGTSVPDYRRECRQALGRSFQMSAVFRRILESGCAPWLAWPVPGPWLIAATRPRFRLAF